MRLVRAIVSCSEVLMGCKPAGLLYSLCCRFARSLSLCRGHTAVAHPDGRVSMMGRPSDFRNVLKHINTYNRWPALQRAMRACTRVMFPADNGCNELKHPIPGERALAVALALSQVNC